MEQLIVVGGEGIGANSQTRAAIVTFVKLLQLICHVGLICLYRLITSIRFPTLYLSRLLVLLHYFVKRNPPIRNHNFRRVLQVAHIKLSRTSLFMVQLIPI